MNEERPPADRDDTMERLRRVLHALTMSGEEQRILFPEFVVPGDELALEFDRWYHLLVGHGYETSLASEGVALLSEIDGVFGRMLDTREHVWKAEGGHESADWVTLRRLAERALECLGWSGEDPGASEEQGRD